MRWSKRLASKAVFSVFLAVVFMSAGVGTFFLGVQPAMAAGEVPPGTFPAQYNNGGWNVITPTVNNTEQLEYAIATNPAVQYKWADIVNAMGFGWCGGQCIQNGVATDYGPVGQNLTVKEQTDTDSSSPGYNKPEYVISAINNLYAVSTSTSSIEVTWQAVR